MSELQKPTNLEEVLDRLCEVEKDSDRVSLGAMLEAVGRRSFGPLLLVLGLIPLSPLSAVPGVSTSVAVMVLLTACQLLFGRTHFWLPRWLLRRGVSRARLERAVRFLRPIARFADRLVRPRFVVLTQRAALRMIAALCVVIALIMPPLELLPLANTMMGAALTALGLALTAHDGLLVVIAAAFTVASLGIVAYALL